MRNDIFGNINLVVKRLLTTFKESLIVQEVFDQNMTENDHALFRQFFFPLVHKNEFCFVHNRHLTIDQIRNIISASIPVILDPTKCFRSLT